jgi:hypothetical protein
VLWDMIDSGLSLLFFMFVRCCRCVQQERGIPLQR